jgi:hypothetical protein
VLPKDGNKYPVSKEIVAERPSPEVSEGDIMAERKFSAMFNNLRVVITRTSASTRVWAVRHADAQSITVGELVGQTTVGLRPLHPEEVWNSAMVVKARVSPSGTLSDVRPVPGELRNVKDITPPCPDFVFNLLLGSISTFARSTGGSEERGQ